MKRTLTEQYGLIKKGKGHKDVFLKEAKKLFPNLIRQGATFNEASTILKQKNIINENFVGLGAINNPFEKKKKEGYETAFAKFLQEAEAKAEEKKVSKEVEEDYSKNYDLKDKKDPNNMIFGQIQMGYYCELKNPKNEDKTDQELLEIVYKNLAKDPIYYTKNGQFGVEDLGYTNEAPSLGEPEEPKGEYKSSGYGKLKEHSISMAGGIVTGGGFVGANYMDYFGLNEELPADSKQTADDVERAKDAAAELADELERADAALEEDAVNEMMVADDIEDTMIDAAEELYDDLGNVDKVMDHIRKALESAEQSLRLKYGDY